MRAGPEAAYDRPPAASAVMDEVNGLRPIPHVDAEPHDLAVDRIQRGVSGAGTGIAGAPFRRAAEVAVHHQAVVLDTLFELDAFALDEIAVLAAAYTRPRHAEVSQLAHGNGRLLDEDPGDFLVGAPIRTAHGVEVMHVRTVALRHDAVRQRRLHATLRRAAVAASRRHQ